MLDQPSAQKWANRGSNRGKARPCPDRLTATLFVERCADNRKAAGDQERTSNPLDGSCGDQLLNRRREAANNRRQRKNRHSREEHPASPKEVAERASDQNQRAQEKPVGLDDPLHVHNRRVKTGLQCWQGDINNGAVDESHA